MIDIAKEQIYKVDEFEYVNYIQLSMADKLEILRLRNREEVRSVMADTAEIPEENHLNFILKLESRDDMYYWAIKRDNEFVAFFNIVNIDRDNGICEPGIFYKDTSLKGLDTVLKTTVNVYKFLFSILELNKTIASVNIANNFMLRVNRFIGYREILTEGCFLKQELSRDHFLLLNPKNLTFRNFISKK